MKLIRGGWDIARLMLLAGVLGLAIGLPHTAPSCERPTLAMRVLGSLLTTFLFWPFYRWAVFQFEKDRA